MVGFTAVAVTAIATAGASVVAGGAAFGGVAAGNAAAVVGTSTAVANAAGASTAAGAIGGAVLAAGKGAAATFIGAIQGAVIGGSSAAGVGGLGTGAGAFVAGTGGWGLIVIGTCQSSADNNITYDCWKPVVHDTSTDPSAGMLLADLLRHKNVVKYYGTEGTVPGLPRITLENVWNESFEIEYVVLPETGELAGHAKRLPDNTLDSESRGPGPNICQCSVHC